MPYKMVEHGDGRLGAQPLQTCAMPYRYNANKINRFLRRPHPPPHGPQDGVSITRNPSGPSGGEPTVDFAEFTIGPAHRVRPLAGPMASSGRTRWLIHPTPPALAGRVVRGRNDMSVHSVAKIFV